MHIQNRVTELLGVEIPIVQAPMGWIARAQLASAVSNTGAMGIIETSSGDLDGVAIDDAGLACNVSRSGRRGLLLATLVHAP